MFTMLTKKQLEMVLKFCALDKDECLAVDNLDARQGAREWIMWSEYDCFLNCIGCIFRPFSLRMHFQAFPQSVTGYKFWKNAWNKHRKNCKRCPTQVTWKVKFKCQFCLSWLSCLSCLSQKWWSDTPQSTSFRAETTFPFSSSDWNSWSSNRYQWVVVVANLNEDNRGLSDHHFK